MEDNICEIKKLICDTMKSVKITEAKQIIRDCRPPNELCKDAPHYRYNIDIKNRHYMYNICTANFPLE